MSKDIEIVYKRIAEHEGNDCWISEYKYVVEVGGIFIATKVTKISGMWCLAEPMTDSKDFNDLDEAIKWVEKEF